MNIARTPAEENIWNKLLHIHLDKAMDESPLTPVSEVYAETLKDFFEWKWINLVDTEKPHFTIDEYYEKAKQFFNIIYNILFNDPSSALFISLTFY